jgi:hypothetical protein
MLPLRLSFHRGEWPELLDTLGKIGGTAGFFAIFDALARKEHKKRISDFLFARQKATFSSFESGVIRALMDPFLRNGQLVFSRVLLLSFGSTFVLLAAYLISARVWSDPDYDIWWLLVFGAALVLVCWPFDVFSLYVTKRVFVDRQPAFPATVLWLGVDLAISVVPVLFAAILLYVAVDGRTPGLTLQIVGMAFPFVFFVNAITSTVITIAQVLALVFGSCARLLAGVFRFLGLVANHSRAADFPLTVIGLLVGITLSVTSHLI